MIAVGTGIANAPHLTAFITGGKDSIVRYDVGIVLVQYADFAPAAALPYLAQQFHVEGYRGYLLAQTEQQKRDLIKNAIELHRTAGTPYAIKRAITSVGFDAVIVSEHTGLNHDGTIYHDGTYNHVGGAWYNFSVKVFYTGTVPDAARQELVRKLIAEWKNARSVLLSLTFTPS